MATYGISTTVTRPFVDVVPDVKAALAAQGFGVLTEIDMKATMKAKLDKDIEPYVILGACNPPLAFHALSNEASIGLLLPCNVVIRAKGADTIVEAIDPMTMVEFTGNDALQAVADEATTRLAAALASLSEGPSSVSSSQWRSRTGAL